MTQPGQEYPTHFEGMARVQYPAPPAAAAEAGGVEYDESDKAALQNVMDKLGCTPAELGQALDPSKPEEAYRGLSYSSRVTLLEGILFTEAIDDGEHPADAERIIGGVREYRRSFAEALRGGATREEADQAAEAASEPVFEGTAGSGDYGPDNPEPVTAPPAQDRIATKFKPTIYGAPRGRFGGGVKAHKRAKQADREIDERRANAAKRGIEVPPARGLAGTTRHDTVEFLVGTRGGNGTQEATPTTLRQKVADGIRKVFRRQRPAAAGGNEGNGGNGEIPDYMERLPENLRPAVARVAELKKQLEENVGAGKGGQSRELKRAAAHLKKLFKDHAESSTPAERLRLDAYIDEAVAAERIRIADEKVKGVIPNIGRRIDQFVGWMGKHKKAVGLTALGLAAAASGGIVAGVALGAGAAMATAATYGAAGGGALGTLKGYLWQRGRRALANTREAVEGRYTYSGSEQLIPGVENPKVYDKAWYESSRKFRDAQGKEARNKIVGGAVVGAAVGAAGAAAGVGYGALGAEILGGDHTLGRSVNGVEPGNNGGQPGNGNVGPDPNNVPDYPPPPGEGDIPGGGEGSRGVAPGDTGSPLEGAENVEEGLRSVIENDPSRINEFPGLEDRNFHEVTAESAADQYPGENPWSSLQTGAELNNQQTLNAIVDGWSELHDTPGVKVDTWGDIHLNEATGKFETTGNLWGGNVAVENMYAVDANGDIYHFDGQLDNSQHAQLLDLMRQDGTELMNADQLAEHLADDVDISAAAEQAGEAAAQDIPEDTREALDAQADALVEELGADLAGDTNITRDEVQRSLNSYVADHRGTFTELSDPELNEYLSREVTLQTQSVLGDQTPKWVHPAEVQKMLDEAWRVANANASVDSAPAGGMSAIN